MTLVLRYISDETSELYKLRRGKLNFLKTGPINSLLSKKFRLVILSKENFVSSLINVDDLNFTPDADQFLFSEKSIMSPEDILFNPPKKMERNKTWEQVWVSASKLKALSAKLPYAQKFFPENIAVESISVEGLDQSSSNTLDGFRFDTKTDFFDLKFSKKRKPQTILILGMIFLSALPWLPYSSDFIFGPTDEIELFDNSIRTLDIFSELSASLSLPDLKGLQFNQTNDLIRITTNEGFIFDKELKDQIEAFCEASGCSVEFWDAGIIVRKEK
jgi:hypothetical protein